jgi:hypothetical protein
VSDLTEIERKRVIALAHEKGEFLRTECGTWIYWPGSDNIGGYSACLLQWLAAELERLNAIEIENERKFFNDLESAEGVAT